MSSSSNTSTNIIPKDCSYGCNTRIYWDTSQNAYLEVFSKQKHICKNRSVTQTTTKPNYYYNKRSWSNNTPKPKMSNSLELLTGPIEDIQKKYEILSDIVTELGGKTHGSQSHINGNIISLIVYFEVPEGKREEVKQRFNNFTKNLLVLQQ